MGDEWNDGDEASVMTSSFNSGRSFSRGRGFIPASESENSSFSKYDSNGYDFERGRGGRGGGRGSRGGGGRGDGRRDGFRGDRNDDESGGGGYRGRRNDDSEGGSFRGRRNEGGDRGGFRGRRNDGDGDEGGFRGRRNEDGEEGGFRGRRNEDGEGGGYRGRRNEDGEGGGYRGRRNEDGEGGGYRGRRNEDGEGGGYRGRRNEDGEGGGYRGKRNDDNGNSHKEDGEEQKPRPELYIPPDPTDDEATMFAAGISSGINFDKYYNIKVNVSGENVPRPIETFESSGLRPYILENVKKSGYLKPTPIQKHAIPIVMSGRDLMGCAQTGSGKTAAFLLPIINVLLNDKCDVVLTAEHCEPYAVIISPTRELTLQIFNESRKFALGSLIKTVVTYGGTAAYHQAQQIMRGCHILVATPGRLVDFLNRGRITFSSLRFLVLDEADRMLDMGFMPDIEKMVSHPTMVPTGERQTLMFSATFPEEIQRLAGKFLHDYLFVTVGIVGGACTDVEQNFHMVSRFDKRAKLLELLKERGTEKTLVFVEMKRTADFIAAYLSEQNIPTTSIHGDRLQREREEALSDFKCGRMDILVATGVAARGLDIKNVAHVVNYDLPKSIDEYVHRIGRTGRVGNRGRATSFYDGEVDQPIARDLVRILTQAEKPVPSFLERDAQGGGGGGGGRTRGGGGFGGRDVRRFDGESGGGGGGSSQPAEEEEW